MILCDLPYGTTNCEWDKKLDLDILWEQYRRIIKDNGVIALFSQQPFSADLINTERKMFRYEWIWEKSNAGGFLNARRMPMRAHENILIFYKNLPTYNIQFEWGKPYKTIQHNVGKSYNYKTCKATFTQSDGRRYPRDVIKFKSAIHGRASHPAAKPVGLLEYFIKTYTNEGDTVLDNCMGSGSTGVACVNTGRSFMGMEIDKGYFETAKNRIEEAACEEQALF